MTEIRVQRAPPVVCKADRPCKVIHRSYQVRGMNCSRLIRTLQNARHRLSPFSQNTGCRTHKGNAPEKLQKKKQICQRTMIDMLYYIIFLMKCDMPQHQRLSITTFNCVNSTEIVLVSQMKHCNIHLQDFHNQFLKNCYTVIF